MTPRLYINTPLAPGAVVALTTDQAHYLRNVLRRAPGADLMLFNENDGEFSATLNDIGKKRGAATIDRQLRPATAEPSLTLLFAPVKRTPTEYIIEKGTELGVAAFAPVITARTNADRLKIDRLQAIATEAAEQCGRLSIPRLSAPVRLEAAIAAWPQNDPLIFCDEAGEAPSSPPISPSVSALDECLIDDAPNAAPFLSVVHDIATPGSEQPSQTGILIGPEGGFTSAERQSLRRAPHVRAVSLGPRILRADTAVIAALSLWQSIFGDWG